jgi:uncharacterized protein (UPF0332 family)
VSPRSEEFMAGARERLADARTLLDAGGTSGVVGLAYYAMLYAARAALSEEDQNAKTHSGTWNLFKRTYVDSGRFSVELYDGARRTQATREATDYDALTVPTERAEEIVALAERFVAATAAMLGG